MLDKPCSLVEIVLGFRGANCLHHQGDDGGISTSETSVNFYETTRRNIQEDSHLRFISNFYILFWLQEMGTHLSFSVFSPNLKCYLACNIVSLPSAFHCNFYVPHLSRGTKNTAW
jgi:hypothetical protein